MKHLVLGLLLLICFKGLGQNEKNDFDNVYQIGEKYYGDFQILNNIDLFLNRSLNDTTALTYRTQKLRDTLTDANWIYTVISELKSMSKDANAIPNLMDIFYDVQHYKSELAYEEGKEIFPIGILDYDYYWMKENFSKTRERKVFKPKQFEQSKLNRERLKLIAPLFDYSSLSRTGIIIKRQHFYSNRHLVEDINKLIIEYKNEEYEIQFNEPFEFKENFSQNQIFTLKVYYNNGDSIVNHCKIQSLNNSGDNLLRNSPPPDADKIINEVTNIGSSTLKLKGYVFMSHCNPTTNSSNPRIIKPFILVAGYRPPIPFLNGYKRTWENFNENHEDLLMQLRKNGYDVIIVQNNMNSHPFKFGIDEAANLLIKLIEDINSEKASVGGEENENVILGASMGCSVIRLALLKMEEEHFRNENYPHHHSRLFIAYDGNFYGANLPLAYQFQVYSGQVFPVPASSILSSMLSLGGVNVFLKIFLHSVLEEKSTKELLQYHALGIGNEDFIYSKNLDRTWEPNYTSLRKAYLNKLNGVYDQLDYYPKGKLFTPVPSSTRNIAVSLGRIAKTNDLNDQGLKFNSAGENWRNVNLLIYKHILRAAQHQSSKLIFQRKIGITFLGLNIVDQKLKVKNMQEVDNASGSPIKGMGNFLALTNIAYGFNWLNAFNKPQFTNKSVLTALAINKEIWPSDGSHTMNMQNLGLMYIDKDINNQLIQSNYYGYPNLGRPNDHFEVTPFEAIYVSDYIIPHINLEDVPQEKINPINDFIKNEVEPCYLYLQNQNLGKQARSSYLYKARRRANNTITTGYLVTPSTDPGDYIVEPNANLKLEAGDAIILKPGTHIKSGAKAHLLIKYNPCPGIGRPCAPNSLSTHNTPLIHRDQRDFEAKESVSTQGHNEYVINMIKAYPNPTRSSFTVSSSNIKIQSIKVFSINGKHLATKEYINEREYKFQNSLDKGTYILIIQTETGKLYHKKIVLL